MDAAGRTPGSRRERLRQQLLSDTRRAARQIAAVEGIDGLTLAAVARAVGVSPPALYRYFDGRDGLVRALYDDMTAELIATVTQAVRRQDRDDLSAQLYAGSRAVFDWSLANRAAFDLLMGSAYAAAESSGGDLPQVIPRELGGLFGQLFTELWRRGELAYPADDELTQPLRGQVDIYRQAIRPELPLGVMYLMITCWRQIYGVTCMAVYSHLRFAFGDHHDLFHDMIVNLLGMLGLRPSPNLR
ncbi:TetR family transcriptional regulator [Streptomyces sp. P9(2023)]|uniref:TetR family transcriptional regulator n=1 Tax=Streptomyces sp. P9(2023) TaxID=3064394 RepID=UPI0028F3FFF6|nr:TetR family transcriptional regulator [Streptomyces sp. P9(2023)]MDT9692651.1 TetR family transcriptional regulator [Streptomyces sp. P9(2023)]